MQSSNNKTVSLDLYSRVVMTLIAGLLLVIAAGLWAEVPVLTDSARAADEVKGAPVFDPGHQRAAIITQLQQTNAKLDELRQLLMSGEVQVKLVDSATTQDIAYVQTPNQSK